MITKTEQFESKNTKALYMAIRKEKLVTVNLILINEETWKSAGRDIKSQNMKFQKNNGFHFTMEGFVKKIQDGIKDKTSVVLLSRF